MSTLEQDAQIEGFNALLDSAGRTLQWVRRTGQPVDFIAILTQAPPIDPESQLSVDVREKTLMQVMSPGPAIALNDTVIEPGTANQWQVLWREDNPTDWATNYVMAKITEQDS